MRDNNANAFRAQKLLDHGIDAAIKHEAGEAIQGHAHDVHMGRTLQAVQNHHTQQIANATQAELIARHNFPQGVAGIVAQYVHNPRPQSFAQQLLEEAQTRDQGAGGPSFFG